MIIRCPFWISVFLCVQTTAVVYPWKTEGFQFKTHISWKSTVCEIQGSQSQDYWKFTAITKKCCMYTVYLILWINICYNQLIQETKDFFLYCVKNKSSQTSSHSAYVTALIFDNTILSYTNTYSWHRFSDTYCLWVSFS